MVALPAAKGTSARATTARKALLEVLPAFEISFDVPTLVKEIRETARAREDLHRAEKRLVLQMKAIERFLAKRAKARLENAYTAALDMRDNVDDDEAAAGDPDDDLEEDYEPQALAAPADEYDRLQRVNILVLNEACKSLRVYRREYERRLELAAKALPVWLWAEGIRGFGALGLALIIGETGDLSNYANPAKLWKRMGLAVIDGERQRRVTGQGAMKHGYVPRRRAVMYVIGDSLLKGNQGGLYAQVYQRRKAYEMQMHPEFAESALDDAGKMRKKYPFYYHRRAQRYMEKLLLKHLWQAWRELTPQA